MERAQAIVITGTVGAGKTSTMSALSELLETQAISHAAIDLDMLRWYWPKPMDDPFGEQLGRTHLAMMANSYLATGIRLLILADVIENAAGRDALAAAIPDFDLHVVRLRVPMGLIAQRLRQREAGDSLAWHLHRAPELEAIQTAANVGDVVIDVGHRTPGDVAAEIAQWLERLHR